MPVSSHFRMLIDNAIINQAEIAPSVDRSMSYTDLMFFEKSRLFTNVSC